MHNFRKQFLFLIAILVISSPALANSRWDCQGFAKVKRAGNTLLTLEACTYAKGYNGKVKWKITNHTNQTLYSVSVADKDYTLSDRRTVSRSGESITSKLAPGATKYSMSDAVNTAENTGSWSDKNNNPVVRISLENPMIKFAMEKYGRKIGWGQVGTVVME